MIGSLNPCPFRVGGGATPSSKAYHALKRVVGEGGSAKDETGLDGLWRRSRAKGLAAVWCAKERATLQFFPHLATDGIEYYERVTGLVRAKNEADATYRLRLWAAFVASIRSDVPHIDDDLKAIDSRIEIIEPGPTTTTVHGRAFGPLHSTLESPAMAATVVPNYSTDFVLYVFFDVNHSGPPTTNERRTIERVNSYLRGMLPSWVSFVIMTEVGFTLDLSSLDLTGFGV